MLRLLASILLISSTLGHPVTEHFSEYLQNLLQNRLKLMKIKIDHTRSFLIIESSHASLTVLYGSSLFIECEISGAPSPAVHWLKDGRLLSNSELSYGDVERPLGMRIIKTRLYLDNVTQDQAGVYTCVAENGFNSQKNISVSVKERHVRQVPVVKRQDVKPARITVWASTTLEPQGTDIRLFCRSEGNPTPNITWHASSNKKIQDNEKYKVEKNGDLVIRHLSWRDMDSYICQGENDEQTDSVDAFVYPLRPEF